MSLIQTQRYTWWLQIYSINYEFAKKAKGDCDPLDVIEIGEFVAYPGQVKQVKVLGVMALLDEGI